MSKISGWNCVYGRHQNLPLHTSVSLKCLPGSRSVQDSPSASCLQSWGAGRDPVDSLPLWPQTESHTWESEGHRQLLSVSGSHSGSCVVLECCLSPTVSKLFFCLQTHAKLLQISYCQIYMYSNQGTERLSLLRLKYSVNDSNRKYIFSIKGKAILCILLLYFVLFRTNHLYHIILHFLQFAEHAIFETGKTHH